MNNTTLVVKLREKKEYLIIVLILNFLILVTPMVVKAYDRKLSSLDNSNLIIHQDESINFLAVNFREKLGNNKNSSFYSQYKKLVWIIISGMVLLGLSIFILLLKRYRRKGIERSLHESKERLQLALWSTKQGVWDWNLNTGELYLSKDWIEMLGYQLEEIELNMISWRKIIHPEDVICVVEKLNNYLAGETLLYEVEYRLRTKDGDWKWILDKGKIVSRCKEGKPLRIIGVYQDITTRKQTEEKVEASERMYRMLFENTGTAMLISDEDTTISLINHELEEKIGYSKEEVEGKKSWQEFIVDDDKLEQLLDYHYQRINNNYGVPDRYEVDIIDSIGRHRTVLTQVSMIPGTKKSIISLIDITNRKKAEEKVKYMSYLDNLTGLYNRNYYQKMLQKLDNVKNLPLSIIIGDNNGLKLINDTFGHDKGDQFLQEIATILKSSIRKEDIIARWGGDEFGIILPQTTEKGAQEVISRIKEKCKKSDFKPISPSIALGVATKTDSHQSIQKIIEKAEDRMYCDKLNSKKGIEDSMIESLEKTLLSADNEIKKHVNQVRELALKLGKSLELSAEQIDNLALLARLHDIGKLAILDRNESESSTQQGMGNITKQHPEIGYRMVKNFQPLTPIANGILFHHERWDGKGYPEGLRAEEIPLLARIISVVNSYANIVKDNSMTIAHQEAIDYLQNKAGTKFDPQIVDEFIRLINDKKIK